MEHFTSANNPKRLNNSSSDKTTESTLDLTNSADSDSDIDEDQSGFKVFKLKFKDKQTSSIILNNQNQDTKYGRKQFDDTTTKIIKNSSTIFRRIKSVVNPENNETTSNINTSINTNVKANTRYTNKFDNPTNPTNQIHPTTTITNTNTNNKYTKKFDIPFNIPNTNNTNTTTTNPTTNPTNPINNTTTINTSTNPSINTSSEFFKKKDKYECSMKTLLDCSDGLHIEEKENNKLLVVKLKQILFVGKSKNAFEKAKHTSSTAYIEKNINAIQKKYQIPDMKFWMNRYYYYVLFDNGIQMDYESWYSVTPEEIASYTARICGSQSTVVDAFCGSGGNVIQFSLKCKRVIAIDIDPIKINICKNNAKVYSCTNNINFLELDFLEVKGIKADYVFLSPPWGGVEYKDTSKYSMKEKMTPDILQIVSKCLEISNKIIFYIPRTSMLEELYEILNQIIEKNNEKNNTISNSIMFLDVHILNSANKIKACMIFFGRKMNDVVSSGIFNSYLLLLLLLFTIVIDYPRRHSSLD